MADNVAITAGSGTTIATDDVGGTHFQRVKLVDGTLDGTGAIGGDATNGLDVDVTRLPGSLAGIAEDVLSQAGDVGMPILAVRNDTPSSLVGTDKDYTMVAADAYGRLQTVPQRSLPKSIGVSGSLGITTAAVWDEWAAWAVPANYLFVPKMARCAVTTAATRTIICAGKRLATWNPGTNTFTDDGSVTTPDWYDRMFYRVNTTHSATATNVTVTYTDQDGNGGATTSALTIPASAPGGNWYEFTLATSDFGVQDVTNVSDSANPTSVVDEIWGVRTLLEDNGPANTPHIAYLGEGLKIPNGETVFILFNAAATTAQQRFAQILGDLIAA